METITDLNNLAVTCMDANKLKEAMNILVNVLHLTRNQLYYGLGSPNIAGETMSCPSSSSTCAASSAEAAVSQGPMTSMVPSLTHHDIISTTMGTNNDHLRCRVGKREMNPGLFKYSSARKYHHPFCIFQREIDLSSHSESRATATIQLSAIVIFNCALCHDLLAQSTISPATRRDVLRAKAIALYEKVVELYFESGNPCMTRQEDYMTNALGSSIAPRLAGAADAQQDVIVMAAANNLVQLHHESSEERKSYSRLMMAMFHEIQRTDYGNDEIQRHVDSQARVFVSNTVTCWKVESAAAAA